MKLRGLISILLALTVACSVWGQSSGPVYRQRVVPRPKEVTPAPKPEASTDKEPVGFMWIRYAKEISSHVPKTMMIAHTPSLQLDKARERKDLPEDIATREVAYTWWWLTRAVQSNVLRKSDKAEDLLSKSKTEDFRFFSNVGVHKDDVLLLAWSRGPSHFTVVDGRFLVLSVRIANKAQVNVEATFKRAVAYGSYSDRAGFEVQMETLSPTDSNETWGRITVDRARRQGWLESPVEWYQAGNEVMFAFEKTLKPGLSKLPWEWADGSRYVGGLPVQDSRPYLRFEKSNRKELAQEYYLKRKPEMVVPKGTLGAPYGARKVRERPKED